MNDTESNPKCREFPIEILFKNVKIFSIIDTLYEILIHKKFISRFGDGELSLIEGRSIIFQRYNCTLAKKLKEVLYTNLNNLLVGVYLPYKKGQLDLYYINESNYWKAWLEYYKFFVIKLINKNKKYYSSDITRFYYKYKDKSKIPQYIAKFKQIWDGKDILIV